MEQLTPWVQRLPALQAQVMAWMSQRRAVIDICHLGD